MGLERDHVAEQVVVAGRGVVLAEDRDHIDAKQAEVVDAAALALTVAAAGAPCASGRLVAGDRAAGHGQGADAEGRGAIVVDAAAQAVATVAAGASRAADGLVVAHDAIADGEGGPGDIRAAAQPIGAVAANELAAERLVVLDGAVADRGCHRHRPAETVQEATADAVAGEGAAAIADPADGLVVAEGQVVGDQGRRIADPAALGRTPGEVAAAAGVVVAADGLVVSEGTVRDGGHASEDSQAPTLGVADEPTLAALNGGVGTTV